MTNHSPLTKSPFILTIVMTMIFAGTLPGLGQKKRRTQPKTISFNQDMFEGFEWRGIGPYRGGRSAAVTGVPGRPGLFYMGATGGGIWKTGDGGSTWENISDDYFGGSIGAVAVSEYDNNIIYVGGGEVTVRGNVSYGYGMWKSEDAGVSWKQIGLKESRHIPRIRIHPKNPKLVYAAVLGDLYKSSDMRGIYRSNDGGESWKRILFTNEDAGAVDLVLDPNNARIIYASTWRVRRTPYSLESGGEGSALWKSVDGGDTWDDISKNQGLPTGTWGISGVTVSPQNSNRVWAIVENKDGGVFRSDDAGKTWKKVNDERSLRQRAWYYTRIYADTEDEDKVYVLNVNYHRSKDGGKTFQSFAAPHGDHHDLWIDPQNSKLMIMADDGGAQVTYDAGENWSTYYNQPTAQFYRVTTDNHFPYRIYGAQQDNSTIRIYHRTSGSTIGERAWEPTAGGESAHLAVDPKDNDIVYGGSYDGFLTRINHKTKEVRAINVWPDNPMGHGAEEMKYRFQWNFPIFFSPHNPQKLYTASNHMHVSFNEGQSWQTISPDLTTNDSTKLGASGGPITKDNTSVEYYCTIFAAAESPLEKDLLWTGSDDGLIHVSKDGGKNWENVTPSNMPRWTMINSIEIDPFRKGGVYIAGTRYKLGDYAPFLYKSKDYGKTWTKITSGIKNDDFTRVLRADPNRDGLLYAGTERGVYVSLDDGLSWNSFQLNLPVVPITDLAIKNDNLIAATQGRSFWMIDDLTPLHQLNESIASSNFHLFKPMPSYRMKGRQGGNAKRTGQNHPGGVMVHYFLKDTVKNDTIKLEFIDSDGKLIREFSTAADKNSKSGKLEVKKNMNRFVWDMRYPQAEKFEGMILWWASLDGPKALPGKYRVKLTVNNQSSESDFEILPDPRSTATAADLQSQFDFLMSVRDKMSETNSAIKTVREVRKQINLVTEKMKEDETMKDVIERSEEILKRMEEIEESLYQTKNQSQQDPLNFPIRLNNKLGHLNSLSGIGDFKPTDQDIAFKKEVTQKIDHNLEQLKSLFENDIPAFNKLVKEKSIDAIIINSQKKEANP